MSWRQPRDKNGLELHVGDIVRVQETSGRYGQTRSFAARLLDAVIAEGAYGLRAVIVEGGFTVYGSCGNSHYSIGSEYLLQLKTTKHGDQYWCHHTNQDWEHGHDTFVEIIQPT